MKKVLIIAEAGVNHNGDINLAKKLIEEASKAGADYIKFQTFKAANLVTGKAKKAAYQANNIGASEGDGQMEMLKKLELSHEDHYILKQHCDLHKIKFMSTGFDDGSIDFLIGMNLDFFKIPSGEITNLPYLKKIAAQHKPVILSTGMATMNEVEAAVEVLVKAGVPKKDITVLHCNTDYPTAFSDVNLLAMLTIGKALSVNIGYSDHTLGIEVPIAATALGATVIEKHFTLDNELPGPDHKASLQPEELKEMIRSIRNIEKALGASEKAPSASEFKNIGLVRKSIHLKHNVKSGSVLTEDDFVMKRPFEGGISPMDMEKIVGRRVKEDLYADHQLKYGDLE